MTPHLPIPLQTKQNFMEAFWALYCERRLDQITVKAITQRAGYNRSTFYAYFQDVEDVLNQLEDSLIPQFGAFPPIAGLRSDLGMEMNRFMDLFEHQKKYYAVLLSEKGDPGFASKLKQVIKPILMSTLTDSTTLTESTLDYTLEYTLSAMIGILSYWINHPAPLPKEALYDLVHQLMSEGPLKQLHPAQPT